MKTVKKKVEEILYQAEDSRIRIKEDQADIDKLKQIVLLLAQQIDNIHFDNK